MSYVCSLTTLIIFIDHFHFPGNNFDLQASNRKLLTFSQQLYKVLFHAFTLTLTQLFFIKLILTWFELNPHKVVSFLNSMHHGLLKEIDIKIQYMLLTSWIYLWLKAHTSEFFSIMCAWHNLWLGKSYANFGQFVKSCFGEYKQVRFSVEFCSLIKVLGIRFNSVFYNNRSC